MSAIIQPNWSAPSNIKAFCTTRLNPKSQWGVESKLKVTGEDYSAFNLATHVEDHLQTVLANRQVLGQTLALPEAPVWLNQQHTDRLIQLPVQQPVQLPTQLTVDTSAKGVASDSVRSIIEPPVADASFSQAENQVCVVMTADCLPILLCDKQGEMVCAIHAGWQGLYKQIIGKTVAQLPKAAEQLMAWIGPGIGPQHFEVDQAFYQRFADLQTASGMDYCGFFKPVAGSDKYLGDLPAMAEAQLRQAGVSEISQSGLCSYERSEQFYSYRRACHHGNGKTGRFASLIWIEPKE